MSKHFRDEMADRIRFSSKEIRAFTRAAYIKLFCDPDEKYDYHRDQFYDVIMACRLSELPKRKKIGSEPEPYIMRAVIDTQKEEE